MKGSIDITDYFYKILNVSQITSQISGSIFKEAYDLNDENENIVIITNSITSGRKTGVQNTITNINLLISANTNGTPKLNRFRTLTNIIRDQILKYERKDGYYYELTDEALIRDNRQNLQYYYNFKIMNFKI